MKRARKKAGQTADPIAELIAAATGVLRYRQMDAFERPETQLAWARFNAAIPAAMLYQLDQITAPKASRAKRT